MNYEFKGLIPVLNAFRRDVKPTIETMLEPFKEILPNMKIIVGIIIECPYDCKGLIALSSGMRETSKVVCPVCHKRIDIAKWRTKYI